jgi:hypothetical protein
VTGHGVRLATVAFLLAAALAWYPLVGAGREVALLAMLGATALLLAAVGVVGLWPGALSVAVGLLAAEYLVSLFLHGARLDVTAPAYGACLFVFAELGWLAIDGRGGGSRWPTRWFGVAGLALAAAGLGWALLILSALPMAGGLAVTTLGVVAALVLAVSLGWLARSSARP